MPRYPTTPLRLKLSGHLLAATAWCVLDRSERVGNERWIMQTRQFANLKRRAERTPAADNHAPVRSSPPAGIAS